MPSLSDSLTSFSKRNSLHGPWPLDLGPWTMPAPCSIRRRRGWYPGGAHCRGHCGRVLDARNLIMYCYRVALLWFFFVGVHHVSCPYFLQVSRHTPTSIRSSGTEYGVVSIRSSHPFVSIHGSFSFFPFFCCHLTLEHFPSLLDKITYRKLFLGLGQPKSALPDIVANTTPNSILGAVIAITETDASACNYFYFE